MSTPAITVTVDLDTEGLAVTGDIPEFRKDLDVTLVESDLLAASALILVLYRGTCVGACEAFTADGDDLVGTVDLNTTALESAFEGRAASAIIPLSLQVYDTSLNEPVAMGKMVCRNNQPSGFDIPAAVDVTEYMRVLDYDADADGVIDQTALP